MTWRLRQISFSRVFKSLSRKHGFLGRFLFPDSLFLTHSCQLLEPLCSETAFVKQRLTSVDFPDDKILFFSSLSFEVTIVTSNLRCYFSGILCLISPDFATCSLALHMPVVSDVIKRLSTFASHALSTLAPNFYLIQNLYFMTSLESSDLL